MRFNQIKLILRNLWRRRLFTLLNVLGLSIGISVCWIIFRVGAHEFSFDSNHPNKDNIVKVISHIRSERKETRLGGVSAALYQGIRAEIPGLKQVVPVFKQWITQTKARRNSGDDFSVDMPENVVATDAAYFKMTPYTWVAGNPATALAAPDRVVLTESRARLYFPDRAPDEILGAHITYYGSDTLQRTVSGIVKDYHTPSEFTAQEFLGMDDTVYPLIAWTNTNGSDQLYLQLDARTDPDKLLHQINEMAAAKWEAAFRDRTSAPSSRRTYEFIPLTELHFSTEVSEYGVQKTNKRVLYGLLGIGLFVMLLACINYINLSVAQVPQRSKEIGIRKTLGSRRRHLIGGFLLETILTLLLAFVLSIGLSFQVFNLLEGIIPPGVQLGASFLSFTGFVLATLAVVTILAGLYPGWMISRISTLSALKTGQLTFSGRRFSLQKVLIVLQFAIAQVFIIVTLIVSAQLRYMIRSDMGFNKDAIVLFSVPWKYASDPAYLNKVFVLQETLRNQPGVEGVALGTPPLSSDYASSPFEHRGAAQAPGHVILYKKVIDSAYLSLYQMNLLAGRNIRTADTVREYLINETAARELGFSNPEKAVGKQIAQLEREPHTIAGVVKDFHTQDFYAKIQPLVMMHYKSGLNTLNVKLSSGHPERWQKTLTAIQSAWKTFYPDSKFDYEFYDQSLEAMYKQERQVSVLIHLSAIMSICISCLGLFGLSTLLTFQRTREIGIRKVLGASFARTLRLLTSDFVKLVLLAIVIASPLAWWAGKHWLNDFVYRIDLTWPVFVAGAGIALGVALLTVSYQTFRVARAKPVDSLRDD